MTWRRVRTVLAAGAVLVACAACQSDPKSAPPAQPTPTDSAPPATADPSTQPTGAPTTPVDFTDGGVGPGVEIADPAALAGLEATSADFRAFIAGTLTQLQGSNDCAANPAIYVEVYDPRGYARGGVSVCGGFEAYWAVVDGAWKEVVGTQSDPPCQPLEALRFPLAVVGPTCDDTGVSRAYSSPL